MQIKQITSNQLSEYTSIPISFWVNSIYKIEPIDGGLSGFTMSEEPVKRPWLKNYDENESPLDWPRKFNIENWGLFIGYKDNKPAAGAAVALNTPEVNMLENRKNLAVLWDIRVHPDWRDKGLGKEIFLHASHWAQRQGCTQLKIETQNVNVPACKFYQAMGCQLGMIHRFGYAAIPEVATEAMLFWYLDLISLTNTK